MTPSTHPTLRPLVKDDVRGVFVFWSDTEVVKFTNWPKISSLEECAKRVDRILVRYGEGSHRVGPFCVVGDDGCILGLTGLDANEPFDGQNELWYLFRRDCWGKGLGTRAMSMLMTQIRGLATVSKVVASAVASNVASWKILERNGFRRIGTTQGGFDRDGLKLDIFEYERHFQSRPNQLTDPTFSSGTSRAVHEPSHP
jgi:ribosomal-protein-alanine N-acetyltransferase